MLEGKCVLELLFKVAQRCTLGKLTLQRGFLVEVKLVSQPIRSLRDPTPVVCKTVLTVSNSCGLVVTV